MNGFQSCLEGVSQPIQVLFYNYTFKIKWFVLRTLLTTSVAILQTIAFSLFYFAASLLLLRKFSETTLIQLAIAS